MRYLDSPSKHFKVKCDEKQTQISCFCSESLCRCSLYLMTFVIAEPKASAEGSRLEQTKQELGLGSTLPLLCSLPSSPSLYFVVMSSAVATSAHQLNHVL